MSQHRPYVSIVIDVHLDQHEEIESPEDVVAIAKAAWSDIKDWVANGYEPVVEVVTPSLSTDVDLETGEEI